MFGSFVMTHVRQVLFFTLILGALVPDSTARACFRGDVALTVSTAGGSLRIEPIDGGVIFVDPAGSRTVWPTPSHCGPQTSELSLRGGGEVALTGSWAGSLRVDSDGPVTVAETVRVAGSLTIAALEIRVSAPIAAPDIALTSAGRIWIESPITARAGAADGQIVLDGEVVLLAAPISADGDRGGRVAIAADRAVAWSPVTANGSTGRGGTIVIRAGTRYLATEGAGLDASGLDGGLIKLWVGAEGRLAASNQILATGTVGAGGEIHLNGGSVALTAATVDAGGATSGGTILVGEGARTTELTPATILRADARDHGDGGTIQVFGTDSLVPSASFSTRGGPTGGAGGHVAFLTPGELGALGTVDVGASAGPAGSVLVDPKNLTVSTTGIFPQYNLINPSPDPGDRFGERIRVLTNGNIVVTAPRDDTMALDAGAVYLFDGVSGALKSALFGNTITDTIGSRGVTALTNGNFIVRSPEWDRGPIANAGAITWGNGSTGINGVVSASNSLVGSTKDDQVGLGSIVRLDNGNFVVATQGWDNGPIVDAGAVTWGNGATGITGPVSVTNSLVGTTAQDLIGNSVTLLENDNVVVISYYWDNGPAANAGAVTWLNGATGLTGPISVTNSIVGTTANDQIGWNGIYQLYNGNYVVLSPYWDNGAIADAGAATWRDGTLPTSGVVSVTNSLVGSSKDDRVGSNGATVLTSSNYLVNSPNWTREASLRAGAVTWANGATGLTGPVSITNSLVGSSFDDQVGWGRIFELNNGNYVILSPLWRNGAATSAGAATWANGTIGLSGEVSATNSLVGVTPNDHVGFNGVAVLSNGNYVVASPYWSNGGFTAIGAATWGNGATGIVGPVAPTNSLIGSKTDDRVSSDYVYALTNGNYVVASSQWDRESIINAGAVTWGNGSTGSIGVVSTTNSLVGSTADDRVGSGLATLENGNYVVISHNWNNGPIVDAGAVTWANGATGLTGPVSVTNSLVGSSTSDWVGRYGVYDLPTGNYVVVSADWDRGPITDTGAATWANGLTGITGPVSVTNSLVGSSVGDRLGESGLNSFPNGNYVLTTPSWDRGPITDTGAATWGNGLTATTGEVTVANSVLGRASKSGLSVSRDDVNGAFQARFVDENGGRITVGFDDPNKLSFRRAEAQSLNVLPTFLERTLSAGTSVTVEASNDVTLAAPLGPVNPSGNAGQLTARAGRSVVISGTIATDNGDLTILANEPIGAGVVDSQRDPGPANLTFADGAGVNAGSGSVHLRLGDGTGKTNRDIGSITLGSVSAARLTVESAGTVLIPTGAAISATLSIATTGGTTVQGAASLAGAGTIQGPLTILPGGQLAPGLSPGTLTVNGPLSLQTASTTTFELGSVSDRIEVNGTVTLAGGATITVLPGFVPGTVFKLIDNDGTDPIVGTFTGLPEGKIMTLAGREYRLTYRGGDGNDVVLAPAQSYVFLPITVQRHQGGW